MNTLVHPKILLDMQLNRILKRLMLERDIKASQLSRATKIPTQTLHNWLSGQPPRDVRQIKKVADYFNLTLDNLLFGKESGDEIIKEYESEINAGVFEVILRRVKK